MALLIGNHADKVDENGHRKVVRNGHMPARELVTGIGRVPIKQPRVDDRQLAGGEEQRFSLRNRVRQSRSHGSVGARGR